MSKLQRRMSAKGLNPPVPAGVNRQAGISMLASANKKVQARQVAQEQEQQYQQQMQMQQQHYQFQQERMNPSKRQGGPRRVSTITREMDLGRASQASLQTNPDDYTLPSHATPPSPQTGYNSGQPPPPPPPDYDLRSGATSRADGNHNNYGEGSAASKPSSNPPPVAAFVDNPSNASERSRNFKVVIRTRPPLARELHNDNPFVNTVRVDPGGKSITVCEDLSKVDESVEMGRKTTVAHAHTFTFDYVYDQSATQRHVYETTARPIVDCSLSGYNATIFAYGQTGTGKTYTMEGFTMGNQQGGAVEDRGIIPRAIEQIFGHIQSHASPTQRYLVRASYLQIYNETICDLLKPERKNLTIREDKKRGVFVESLSEWVVRSPAEIYGLMERGGAVRATGSTKMNEISSRSHAVFIIIVEQSRTEVEEEQKNMQRVKQSFKVGKLNLVDLAGSERVRLSGATGQRLEESKKINQSLSALGNVISALTDTKGRTHVPYRDSKLTRILEDSLGGNCKTTMMAMISPALEAMVESVSTLKFANRAKNIKNEPKVNEDLDQKSLLRKYERELKRLRAELEEKNKNVVDKRHLLEVDEQRRRAEADKMAAIRALEARSLEFMKEKEEKKKLEERIAMLTDQMIRGEKGEFSENMSGGHNHQLSQEYHESMRKEMAGKMEEIEKERETIEEEKAQVDRYKQLLLKQRDIMIALTQRLNERDEQIMALQDELDAYDRHQKELEEKLDEKTAQLIHLQRVTLEHNAVSPVTDEKVRDALGEWSAGGGAGMREEGTKVGEDLLAEGGGGGGGGEEKAAAELSEANRRVRELEASLSASKSENQMLTAQLDESKAEKMSMEYVLSENKMSTSATKQELENARSALKEQQQTLSAEIERLREQAKRASEREKPKEMVGSGSSPSAVDPKLVQKNETLIKERRAIKTIMEQKIKVLVNSVAQSTHTVLNDNTDVMETTAGQALAKDMAALKRLVHAAVTALANADGDEGKSSK
ncbi:hypothetical protein TrVE_jg12664 [Triparma verrucosa]|uniref:Kinesin-like protein n=1 Tax=Triparma verrucosa TaxID=1606542 RepID=A0A9W7C2J0_9STRA|nr:hypothetical protein TrVE_jg12664 [Triparma verrucosa]